MTANVLAYAVQHPVQSHDGARPPGLNGLVRKVSATRVEITAVYNGDADAIFADALRFEELEEAMRGLAVYDGGPRGPVQQGDTYTTDVTFWKIFKTRGHVMHVEHLDHGARTIQSREHNPAIRRWDHHLSVQPDGDRVRWTDSVIIDAGWRTPVVARFAAFVYQRRHRHRQALEIHCRIAAA